MECPATLNEMGRLGDTIRAARDRKHLSQEGLADKAHLSKRQISNIERGDGNTRVKTIAAIARVLDLTEVPLDDVTVLTSEPTTVTLTPMEINRLQEFAAWVSERFVYPSDLSQGSEGDHKSGYRSGYSPKRKQPDSGQIDRNGTRETARRRNPNSMK